MPQPFTPRPLAPIRSWLLGTTALLPVVLAPPAAAQAPNAAPTGGQVTAGSATISRTSDTTTIRQGSDRAAIDWQRFDVGRQQNVQFQQPGAGSWTLNRVTTPDPSLIAGRITANGGVAIVNQSGVVFAPGAQVNVGSLIASAANITNENFMAGRMVFDGAPRPGARVENHGSVTVAERGLAALVAPGVSNSGTIRARLGRVALAGAETFTLDLAGDGLLSLDVTRSVTRAPNGGVALVTNGGSIEAPGGTVLLTADAARGAVETLVRNTGRVSADSEPGTAAGQVALRARGGDARIEAGAVSARGRQDGVAGGRVEVTAAGGAASVAEGAWVSAGGRARGGQVLVGGPEATAANVAGRVSARGTGPEGRGGRVEVNAAGNVALAPTARVDASGTAGGGTVTAGTQGVGLGHRMAARTTIAAGAELRADALGRGDGGTVAVNSGTSTELHGLLSARGGVLGGHGGFVELSGQGRLVSTGSVDVRAPLGLAGTLLIDPVNLRVVSDAEGGTSPVLDDNGINIGAGGDSGSSVIKASEVNRFGANVTLQATRDLTVDFEIIKPTGSLTLDAGQNINISLNARISLGESNGAFVARAGNTLTVGANVTVGGTATLRADNGNLILGGNVAAGTTIGLVATNGSISQTAGALTANDLSARAGGFVSLISAGNDVRTLTGSAGGSFTYNGVGNLVVAGVGAGTDLSVTAGGSLTLGANLTAGTAIGLLATSGSISQTAGVLTTSSLSAQARTSVSLISAGNDVRTLAGSAGGSFTYNGVGNLVVAGVGAGTDLSVAAGGSLRVSAATSAGTGSVNLTAGSNLTLAADVAAGTVIDLAATSGSISQEAGVLTAAQLRARAGAAVDLTEQNQIARSVQDTNGNPAIEAGTLAGSAGTSFAFTNAQALTVGTVSGTSGVSTTDGNVALTATALRFDANVTAGIPQAAGAATREVRLTTNRFLAPTATQGTITAGRVGTDAGGQGAVVVSALNTNRPIQLGGSQSETPLSLVLDDTFRSGLSQTGATGRLRLEGTTTGSAITTGAPVDLAGQATNLDLIGTGVTISHALTVPGLFDLRATAGDVSQSNTGALVGEGVAAWARVGSVSLDAAENSIGSTGAGRFAALANGNVSFRNAGSLDIGTIENPHDAVVTARVPVGGSNSDFGILSVNGDVSVTLTNGTFTLRNDVATGGNFTVRAASAVLEPGSVVPVPLFGPPGPSCPPGACLPDPPPSPRRPVFVDLNTSGDIVGGGINAQDLRARSTGGSVFLDRRLNDVDRLAGFARGNGTVATFAFSDTNGFQITQLADTLGLSAGSPDATGGTGLTTTANSLIDLQATGTIAQTAEGALTAAQLRARSDRGVLLDTANNRIALEGTDAPAAGRLAGRAGRLADTAEEATFAFRNGLAADNAALSITVDRIEARGARVDGITVGNINATGLTTAANSLIDLSATDTIAQTAEGVLTAARLRAQADRDVLLDTASNRIALAGTGAPAAGRLAGRAGRLADTAEQATFAFRNALTADNAPALSITVEGITVGDINTGLTRTPNSLVDLQATGTISQTASGTLTSAQLRVRAGGDVLLDGADNRIAAIVTAPDNTTRIEAGTLTGSANREFYFENADALTVGTVLGTSGVTTTNGNVTIGAPQIEIRNSILAGTTPAATPRDDASAVGRFVRLTTDRFLATAPDATITAGPVSAEAGGQGAVILAPRTAGRGIQLGGPLSVAADAPLVVDESFLAALRQTGTNGRLRLEGGSTSAITTGAAANLIGRGTNLHLIGAGVTVSHALTVPGLFDLRATTGNVSQTPVSNLQPEPSILTGARLAARASNGSVSLGAAENQIGNPTTAGGFAAEASGTVALRNRYAMNVEIITDPFEAAIGAPPGSGVTQGVRASRSDPGNGLPTADLLAGGDITQSGDLGRAVEAFSLSARSTGGSVLLDMRENDVDRLAGFAGGNGTVATFAFRDTNGFQITQLADTAGLRAGLLTPPGGTGPTTTPNSLIDLQSTTGTIAQTASGTLTAAQLRARAGGDVLLATANNRIATAVTAPDSTTRTEAGTLAGSAGREFRFLNADGLTVGTVLGTSGVTAGTVVAFEASTGDLTIGSAIGAGAGATLNAVQGSILLGAGVTAGTTIDLNAGGAVTQAAAGVLNAPALRARAGANVELTAADNRIGTLSGSAGAGLAFRDSDALTAGTVLGTSGVRAGSGTLALTAGGDLSVAAASTGTGVSLVATSGALTTTAAVDAGTGDAALLARAGSVTLGAALTAGRAASMQAGSGDLALNGALTAGTTIDLQATGAVNQTAAGVLSAPELRARAGGAVALTAADNTIGTLSGSAGAGFAFRDTDALTAGTVLGTSGVRAGSGTLALTAGGDLSIAAASTGTGVSLEATSGALTTTAAVDAGTGDAALLARAGSVTLGAALTAGRAASMQAGSGDLALNGALTAGTTIDLQATGAVNQTAAGVLSAPELRARAGGAVALTAADNRIGTLSGSAGTGFAFRDADALTAGTVLGTSGVRAGSGTLALTAGGDLSVAAASAGTGVRLEATTGTLATTAAVDAGTGDAALLARAGSVTLGAALTAGRAASVQAGGGDLALNGALTAGTTLDLQATGAVTQTSAGVLNAPELRARAGGAVALTAADNTVGTLSGSAGAGFAFRDADALTAGTVLGTSGVAAGSGTLALTAGGGLTLGAHLLSGTVVTLIADGGDLVATGTRASAAGTLRLSARGRVELNQGFFDAERLVVAAGRLVAAPDGSLRIDPGRAGEATSRIAFSGTEFRIGTGALFTAGGGIGDTGQAASTLSPRDPQSLPLVIFDTRRSATALRDLPGALDAGTTDRPALEPRDQAWQVANPTTRGRLTFGVDDATALTGGGSGPARPAAAGAVRLNLLAGQSPVFLLVDGGTAEGLLEAGRLGIAGTPGEARTENLGRDRVVDLTGSLRGSRGATAAQFGRLSVNQPIDENRYIFEGCVIGGLNCVVIALAQPIALPLANRIEVRPESTRLDPDTVLPDVAEEDY